VNDKDMTDPMGGFSETALGYQPDPEEREWLLSEFRRTSSLMDQVRRNNRGYKDFTAGDFLWLLGPAGENNGNA